eukprot:361984-Chlamydomonas_euryale.AAC.3
MHGTHVARPEPCAPAHYVRAQSSGSAHLCMDWRVVCSARVRPPAGMRASAALTSSTPLKEQPPRTVASAARAEHAARRNRAFPCGCRWPSLRMWLCTASRWPAGPLLSAASASLRLRKSGFGWARACVVLSLAS